MPLAGWACTGAPGKAATWGSLLRDNCHRRPCPSAVRGAVGCRDAAAGEAASRSHGDNPLRTSGQVDNRIATPCGVRSANSRAVWAQGLGPKRWRHRSGSVRMLPASASSNSGAGSAFGDPNTLVGMLMAYAVQLQQQPQGGAARGAEIRVENIGFHPPGSEKPLLDDVNMTLPANSLGLVMGRSGSGKTTLLQVLAGLTEQTSGRIRILRDGRADAPSNGISLPTPAQQSGTSNNGFSAGPNAAPSLDGGATAGTPLGLTVEERMLKVGLVFQFPERHFLGEDLMQELTFTWPRLMQYWGERQALSLRMQQVLEAVGLQDIPLHVQPWALSGGQQRRLALAIQLLRQPALLLLDEPLAGLDWVARQEVVTILRKLKEQCTVLVVSHDLAEIAPLVDCAWRMRIGGTCEPVAWPPADLAGLEQ